jgi:hypothetical protein
MKKTLRNHVIPECPRERIHPTKTFLRKKNKESRSGGRLVAATSGACLAAIAAATTRQGITAARIHAMQKIQAMPSATPHARVASATGIQHESAVTAGTAVIDRHRRATEQAATTTSIVAAASTAVVSK